jgi:hypothetical protein
MLTCSEADRRRVGKGGRGGGRVCADGGSRRAIKEGAKYLKRGRKARDPKRLPVCKVLGRRGC